MKYILIYSLLFASCLSHTGKDACVEITAGPGLSWSSKDNIVQFNGTKAYDTVLSTLNCEILDKSLKPMHNIEVSLINSNKKLDFTLSLLFNYTIML